MLMKKSDIVDDPSFQKYVKKKNLTQSTLDNYIFSLQQFTNANQQRLDPMIKEILEEQYPFIDEDGRIHEYNPEYSKVDDYLLKTVEYLRSKGNSDHSIYAHLVRIRTVLSSLNVKLPKMIELDKTRKKWNGLSREDISYIKSICPLHQQAIVVFLACTGIRIGDARNLQIKDLMAATFPYHQCTEIDDFLDQAPSDMIGYWQFIPQKTKKHKIQCKVYNTPESNNLLLKSLHRRRSSIEKLNLKNGTDLKLEKNDYLFTSRIKNFKGQLNENTITTLFSRRNKEFREHKLRLLSQDLEKKVISKETYDQKLDEIPQFFAHSLRKFFITTLARNRVDLRASAFLEGHKPLMENDDSYVDGEYLADLIWNEYERVIPYLTFDRDSESFEIERKNQDLLVENAKLKDQNKKLVDDQEKMREDFKEEARKLLQDLLKEHNIEL